MQVREKEGKNLCYKAVLGIFKSSYNHFFILSKLLSVKANSANWYSCYLGTERRQKLFVLLIVAVTLQAIVCTTSLILCICFIR
jgi:hypothetical protein